MEYANVANPTLLNREDDVLEASLLFFGERIALASNSDNRPRPRDFFVSTAHKRGPAGKFSVHATLPNWPVLFSGFHTSLKAFMDESAEEWLARSERDEVPSIYDRDGNRTVPWDQGIYQKDRLMRMTFSSKRECDEEIAARQRPLVVGGRNLDEIVGSLGLDAARLMWERSLVCETPRTAVADPFVVTRGSEGADRRSRRGPVAADLEHEIADGGPLASLVFYLVNRMGVPVTKVRFVDLERMIAIFETADRNCPILEQEHRRNTCFLVVFIREYRFEVRCHDPDCCLQVTRRLKQWTSMNFDPSYVEEDDLVRLAKSSRFPDVHFHVVAEMKLSKDDVDALRPPGMGPFAAPGAPGSSTGRRQQMHVLQSGLNTGKTQVVIDAYFKPAVDNGLRALMLVHRQTLAHATAQRFTDESIPVMNYLDPEAKVNEGSFVIVSPESLWRCGEEGTIPKFDLVVMDELTSLLEHVTSSKTMHHSRDLQKTRERRTFVLAQVLRQADMVVVSDGYIRDHDIDFLLTTLRPGAHIGWLVNIQKTNPNHFKFCPIPEVLENRLVERVHPDMEPLIIVCETLKQSRDIFTRMVQRYPQMEPVIGILTSETPPERKRELSVPATWTTLKVLICSPSLGPGIDFQEPHFVEMYAFFSGHAIPSEAQMQMMHRARNLRQKLVNIYVFPYPRCAVLDCTKLEQSYMAVKTSHGVVEMSPQERLSIAHAWYRNLSYAEPKRRLQRIITAAGGTIEEEAVGDIPPEEAREARSAKRSAVEAARATYVDQVFGAPPIDHRQYVALLDKQRQEQNLSSEERLSIIRFRLCDVLVREPDQLTRDEVESWLGHERRAFIFDHCVEFYRNGEFLWRRDHDSLVRDTIDPETNLLQERTQVDYGAAADLREKPVEGLCRVLEGLRIQPIEVAFGGVRFGPGLDGEQLVGWDEAALTDLAKNQLLSVEEQHASYLETFREDGYTALAPIHEPVPGRPPVRRDRHVNFARTLKWLRAALGVCGIKVHAVKEGIPGDGAPGARTQVVTWNSEDIAGIFERREAARGTRVIDM